MKTWMVSITKEILQQHNSHVVAYKLQQATGGGNLTSKILDDKITKPKLLELGRQLVDIKEEARKVDRLVDEFNARNQETIDEVNFSTRYIDEAIESVHEKLGELELNESLGGKKK